MNTILYQNRPEDTQNWTNLYLKPHNCQIYYVNINLRHQEGISATESQTFFCAKSPQRQRPRRNRCFHRLCSAQPTNKLLEGHFEFPFILIGKLTMAFSTGQSWHVLKSWYTAGSPNKNFGNVCRWTWPELSFVCVAGYLSLSPL